MKLKEKLNDLFGETKLLKMMEKMKKADGNKTEQQILISIAIDHNTNIENVGKFEGLVVAPPFLKGNSVIVNVSKGRKIHQFYFEDAPEFDIKPWSILSLSDVKRKIFNLSGREEFIGKIEKIEPATMDDLEMEAKDIMESGDGEWGLFSGQLFSINKVGDKPLVGKDRVSGRISLRMPGGFCSGFLNSSPMFALISSSHEDSLKLLELLEKNDEEYLEAASCYCFNRDLSFPGCVIYLYAQVNIGEYQGREQRNVRIIFLQNEEFISQTIGEKVVKEKKPEPVKKEKPASKEETPPPLIEQTYDILKANNRKGKISYANAADKLGISQMQLFPLIKPLMDDGRVIELNGGLIVIADFDAPEEEKPTVAEKPEEDKPEGKKSAEPVKLGDIEATVLKFVKGVEGGVSPLKILELKSVLEKSGPEIAAILNGMVENGIVEQKDGKFIAL